MITNTTDIPGKPGVYLFKTGDRVLYIGKAKNLKKRVSQYFQRKDHLVIGNLLSEADNIEYIVTDGEADALHLEYNLVHQYRPPFNVRLKDDKTFPMIEISTPHPFPGIFYSREIKPKHFYAGPIVDARRTRELIDTVTRLFQLRTCNDATLKRGTACLYHYIDRCSAPCTGNISQEEYRKETENAIEFLKGKRTGIIRKLKQKMNRLAQQMEFEEAQKIKEDIQLIDQFVLDSYISTVTAGKQDYDVIALHHDPGDNSSFIILFSVMDGRVKKKDFFNFQSVNSQKEDILENFLVSFYHTGNIPHEILVRFLPANLESLEEMFSQIAGRRVVIKFPVKGKKRKTMDLAIKNLNLYINKNKYSLVAERLRDALQLGRFPTHIEGFDISHFSERDRVGAAVVFIDGEPARKKYRNYIIKKAAKGDTEAMKEVLERRFKKMTEYPDLLLIDGGKPQLGAALEIKQKLNIPSDIVALAKREERVYLEGGRSVLFPEDSPERFLLQNIRDEVHRRAVTHHRKRREKIRS
ncbi:MAG: excinuclease ABC subunit UvrC [bacterium]|nr:excinuclease ABC subunit UvrC [bacterium]